MKKIIISAVFISGLTLLAPSISNAAIQKINNVTANNQFLATTSATTTMHMRIVETGTDTHKFEWDSTPWRVDQGGTGTTSLINGSVLFYSDGFSQDNSNFFWDITNKILSIGTNSPATTSKLTIKALIGQSLLNLISSSGLTRLFVSDEGNVGVNNSSPQHALDISGAMYSRLSTTSSSIDWNSGNVQSLTLTSSPTLTFSNGQAGGEYKLIINQDATGGRSVTWPESVIWLGGVEPVLTSTASGTDIIAFVYDGSRYIGYNLNSRVPSGLITSLVSYWKLDESSGNAADVAGSNTLTNNNSITYTTGKINNGADLERGSNNYFSIADGSQSGLDITGDFTFSLWYKPESQPDANDHTFISKWNSGQRSYLIQYSDDIGGGTNGVIVYISSDGNDPGSAVAIFPTTLSDGSWYHLVFVYDASAGTVDSYVNGVAQTTESGIATSIFNGSADFAVGLQTGSSRYADGVIDEVGVWSRVLNSNEIIDLYNSGLGHQYPF